MSSDDFAYAPWATARTSIIVYKGKGILVARARDVQAAILDAIQEFNIKAAPGSVYITALIEGQDVYIGNSGFGLLRDTIPLHIHIRDEDHTREPSEFARWPPPPTHPYPTDQFDPTHQSTTVKQSHSGPGSVSVTSQSRLDSISDWQRNVSGTPDTAPSIHHQHHQPVAPPSFVQSPEQILPDMSTSQSTSPPESQSLVSENIAKPWNWFKKVVKAPSLPPVSKESSSLPPEVDKEAEIAAKHEASAQYADQSTEKPRPAAGQRQSSKRSSRQVAMDIEDILKHPQNTASEISQASNTIKDPSKRRSAIQADHTSFESWGPGGLMLDGEGEDVLHPPASKEKEAGHIPWWGRPVETFDFTKNRNKLGLKPLKLVTSDVESDTGTRKHTQGPLKGRHGSGSPTPKGMVIGLSSPGSPSTSPARFPPVAAAPVQIPSRTPRKRSKENNKQPVIVQRPLTDDFPESPASTRRFTRPAEQLEAASLSNRQQKTTPPKTRKRSQHDVIPVVPIAKTKATKPAVQPSNGDMALPLRARRDSIESREDFPTTPESSDQEGQSAAMRRLKQKQKKKSTVDIRAAVPVAQPETQAVRNRPVRTIINSQSGIAASLPKPVVPVAPSVKPSATGAGTFAAALVAARRHRKDTLEAAVPQSLPNKLAAGQARSRQAKQRSSLSSMRDFVPAQLPAVIAEEEGPSSNLGTSQNSSLLQAPPTVSRSGSVMSRDSYAAGNADTICLDRLCFGPMDISSPNRKGSQLILKALPASSDLSIEWRQEKKVVLNLAFDALSAVQLPGPDCDHSFVLFKVHKGEIKQILMELSKEDLVHFNRFLLVLIAGAGAEIDHLGASAFDRIVDANGW